MSVLVTRPAPFFHDIDKTFAAVEGDGSVTNSFNIAHGVAGKYTVLFFYPMDFTFVCPSEIIAFNRRLPKFKELNVEVIGVSRDNEYVHHAWRLMPPEKGGIGEIGFTLIADVKGELMRAYDVESDEGVALRGSFLIDRDGIVQHQVVNNAPLGRNVDDMLRMVEALQFFEANGEVCPAGWRKGQSGMKADPEGVAAYLAGHAGEL